MNTEKAALRIQRFADLQYAPRFEYGHMAEVAEVCGARDGTELGTGWVRLTDARIPWTILYDEVLTVFDGNLRLHANGEIHELKERDCIWLPSGTELIYEAQSALVHYAIHPSNWHQSK